MLIKNSLQCNNIFVKRFTNIRTVTTLRKYSKNNNEQKGKYDIVIAGGGMVGCTLACAMGMFYYKENPYSYDI